MMRKIPASINAQFNALLVKSKIPKRYQNHYLKWLRYYPNWKINKNLPDPRLKLMKQVRQVMRYHHYAYRTEKTYSDWILRYIKFHGVDFRDILK